MGYKRVCVWMIEASICAILVIGCLLCNEARAFSEAPMLAARVKGGILPPLAQRIPENPVKIQPFDRQGQYGGVWRRAYTGLSDLVGARRVVYDPLVRWSPDYRIIPNLATTWDVEEGGKAFVFHLIKGARWSDGQPFTADDIIFYFDDVIGNKELTPAVPKWLSPSGVPPKATKVDDYTVRIEFDEPHGLFLERLATPEGMALVTKPKHYLKQFHKNYANPEQLAELMTEYDASTWVKLFLDMSDVKSALFTNKDYPSLCAWVVKVPAPGKRFIMERNPYYWKIDTAGNQLPYIDAVVHELQAEAQTIVLKAVNGEIDMQGRHLGGMQTSVLLLSSSAQGKYRLVPKSSTASVGLLLAPNLNHRDPVMRQIISDARFRKALSFAINRTEINKIVCRGKGIPRQAAPLAASPFYSPSYEKAYVQYDTAQAAALLDEMGIKTNREGKRVRPDGEPLRLSLDVAVGLPSWVDMAEIVSSNFRAIGIDTEVKSETKELFRQRTQSAQHDIALWSGDGGMECLLDPRWYFPYNSESLQAPLFSQWYQSAGKKGEEPSQEIKDMMAVYDKIVHTVSDAEKKQLFDKILAANEKNLWVIGLVYDPPDFYVVSPKMFNVPKKDFQSWTYPNPGPIYPEQFSFDTSK